MDGWIMDVSILVGLYTGDLIFGGSYTGFYGIFAGDLRIFPVVVFVADLLWCHMIFVFIVDGAGCGGDGRSVSGCLLWKFVVFQSRHPLHRHPHPLNLGSNVGGSRSLRVKFRTWQKYSPFVRK